MKPYFTARGIFAVCSFAPFATIGLASCDDTQKALEDEATETRQGIVKASDEATKQAAAEAQRKAEEVAREVDASAGQAKKRIREAADTIERKVDKLDKSLADTIRDDEPQDK